MSETTSLLPEGALHRTTTTRYPGHTIVMHDCVWNWQKLDDAALAGQRRNELVREALEARAVKAARPRKPKRRSKAA